MSVTAVTESLHSGVQAYSTLPGALRGTAPVNLLWASELRSQQLVTGQGWVLRLQDQDDVQDGGKSLAFTPVGAPEEPEGSGGPFAMDSGTRMVLCRS